MWILHRYNLQQLLGPTALGMAVFSFMLLMNFILRASEMLIKFGVETSDVLRFLLYSLPHIVVLTIPMAVLLGGLMAFGRMSADFEIVALRSAGISIAQLAFPVLFFAAIAWVLNMYLFMVAMPWGNTKLRELNWRIVTDQIALSEEIQPRRFIETIPDHLLYIQELTGRGEEWQGVFVANTAGDRPLIITAKRAFPRFEEEARTTWLQLEDGYQYLSGDTPMDDAVYQFDVLNLKLYDEDSIPMIGGVGKDDRSMTLRELSEEIARREDAGENAAHLRVEIHKKFAMPVACLVMGLLSLPLGISTRRHTTATGFATSIAVILIYYLMIQNGEQLAEGGILSPWLGMWSANLIFVPIASVLLWKKSREVDWGLAQLVMALQSRGMGLIKGARRIRSSRMIGGNLRWRFPRTLDLYVLRGYVGTYVLALAGFTTIWIVFEYFDWASIVDRPELLPEYMKYRLAYIVHMIVPIAALITVLVTFGLMTKHNEVVATLSGGIGLHRLVLPLLVPAVFLMVGHYLLQDYVLPYSNRRAEEVKQAMRPGKQRSLQQLEPWVYGTGDRVFHYADYDAENQSFHGLFVYYLADGGSRLSRVEYSDTAVSQDGQWRGSAGWRRHYPAAVANELETELRTQLDEFMATTLPIPEPPEYFSRDQRRPEDMTLLQLRSYTNELEQRGFNATRYRVDFHQKLSFPAITLILTLVGIPFAFRTGRHGALFGVGLAVGLSVLFWIAFAVFRAFGHAGTLPPPLAAWAPHLLFLSLAGYLALELRT